jgi:hypothetical protein
LGSAIEGAVGSEQKVDALFLSKHSQIVQRIDELCDTYDRPLLMTADVYGVLSEKATEFCRRIDIIMMKETFPEKHEIYAFDVFPSDPLENEDFDFDSH